MKKEILKELCLLFHKGNKISDHALKRMEEREITVKHVRHALHNGRMIDIQEEEGRYVVAGKKEDGEKFYVVFAIENGSACIITACLLEKGNEKYNKKYWKNIKAAS